MSSDYEHGPVFLFRKYIELIYAVDELWEEFQLYLKGLIPGRRGGDRFELHREPQTMDTWYGMLENMGGGWPLATFASASYVLLRYQACGHDLDKELKKAHRKKIRQIGIDLLNEAKKLPDGAESTTYLLLKAAGYEPLFHEEEMAEIHAALFKAAEKSGLTLDMSKHEGLLEGLPENLDFVIRRGGSDEEMS